MNILMFVSDALRADHLSCYGYDRETTPNIDCFAEENVRYENGFTPSTWTRSVAASLLTGTHPSAHGVKTLNDYFGGTQPRWPEIFGEMGYQTAGISAIGNVSSGLGFDRGFDKFVDLYKKDSIEPHRTTSTAGDELLGHESGRVVFPLAEQVVDEFERTILEPESDDPFFGFLWTIDPHDPYQPPEGFESFVNPDYDGQIDGTRESLRHATTEEDFQRLINLYDAEIAYVDHAFGDLLDRLKHHGVYDETVIFFVGDHGEAFGDHDGNVGHSHVPYEELVHVPIIARYPETNPTWEGEGDLTSLVDLLPTSLDYVDEYKKWDGVENVTGRSILDGGRTSVYSETDYADVQNSFYSVRRRRWKYIKTESPDNGIKPYLKKIVDFQFMRQILTNPMYFLRRRFGESSERLYNLQNDPKERENLVDSADASDDLKHELEQWREAVNSGESDPRAALDDIDDETRDQLREMGYID